jgi:alcohol dehydrogenase class IV
MNPAQNFLQQEAKDSGVPLIAIPTTAGTGSESTRYAVIYFEGKKQSVTHESIIPNYAILEPMLLKTLPLYQKKCTMMDALCQGIESWWSVNSTDESKMFSKIAVQMIMQYWEDYIFHNTDEAAEGIMTAANYAGRAINITQTTAPHAMSYKLTSIYGLPHGHAVALCLPVVWQYMNNHPEQCVDPRGKDYLLTTFDDIARALACHDANEAANYIINLLKILELQNPESKDRVMELEVLTNSVNPTRLKNNPIHLDSNACFSLYELII